jgi:hypothetical protein
MLFIHHNQSIPDKKQRNKGTKGQRDKGTKGQRDKGTDKNNLFVQHGTSC